MELSNENGQNGQFWQGVAVTICIGMVWQLFDTYPLRPGRIAAHYVLAPFLMLVAAWLTPQLRGWVLEHYDGLNRPWRVMSSGIAFVVVCGYFGVALTWIPPAQPPARSAQAEQEPTVPPTIVYLTSGPLPDPANQRPSKNARRVAVPAKPRIDPASAVIENEDAPVKETPVLTVPPKLTAPRNLRVVAGGG